MSSVIVAGNVSGSVTLDAPAVSGSTVITLPTASGTMIATDTSGNVGIGVTPSAWGSTYKAVQVGIGSSFTGMTNDVNLNLANNARFDGTNWIYLANSPAERYRIWNGQHQWFNSPSGTAGNAITFTQAMTLDASGNLLVGTTSAGVGGTNYGTLALAGGRLVTNRNVNGTDSVFQAFGNAGALYVQGNGNCLNTNNSYGSLSDIKIKENIVDATPKLNKLNQVRIVNYNLKTDPENKQIGVIAQELEAVFPSLIEETEDKDKDNNNLGTTTKAVKYSVFVPILIKAIQEQQALITSLTARLDALENK